MWATKQPYFSVRGGGGGKGHHYSVRENKGVAIQCVGSGILCWS